MNKATLAILLLGAAVGLAAGIGGYTFVYANGGSYFFDNAAACANCHVMQEQYDGWIKSSHRAVATCNDCHTPESAISKYLAKAANGFWHSFAFTSGRFPEPIRITPRNMEITERACEACHRELVDVLTASHFASEPVSCVRCHETVGHL